MEPQIHVKLHKYNVFTQLPKRGDIVVKDLATKTPQYIIQDTFVKEELNTSVYEIVGVVYWTDGKKVGVVYKENALHQYCNRAWWYLSGYTLDGAQHTGVISACFASNSWATNLDKTITYNASDMEGLVAALNAASSLTMISCLRTGTQISSMARYACIAIISTIDSAHTTQPSQASL